MTRPNGRRTVFQVRPATKHAPSKPGALAPTAAQQRRAQMELHDDRCATLKGYPCNCASAAFKREMK